MPDAPARTSPFAELLGYRLLDWREAAASVGLTVERRHRNRSGGIHGGVLATLIDTACGYAGTFVPGGPPRSGLTLALTTQFLAPVPPGSRLVAEARRTGGGASIFFASCEVRDQHGTLIARGDGTFRYRNPPPKSGGES
jgi:uncharacterized protein (TIGR00369 family)